MDPATNPVPPTDSVLTPPQETGFPPTDNEFPAPGATSSPIPVDSAPVIPAAGGGTPNVVNSIQDNAGSKKKKILAVFGILLMLLGIGTGVYLVRSQQYQQASAWDCSLYTFSVDKNGTVTVANGSARSEPLQQANVFINNTLVDTFNVPDLAPGQGATLGVVSVPQDATYTWKVEGTKDCSNFGQNEVSSETAQCINILAYDEDWVKLSSTDLAKLKAGSLVRFSVSGTATSGAFDKARFTINNGTPEEVTAKKPGTEEFYVEYTIPANIEDFSISAQLYHSVAGWI